MSSVLLFLREGEEVVWSVLPFSCEGDEVLSSVLLFLCEGKEVIIIKRGRQHKAERE